MPQHEFGRFVDVFAPIEPGGADFAAAAFEVVLRSRVDDRNRAVLADLDIALEFVIRGARFILGEPQRRKFAFVGRGRDVKCMIDPDDAVLPFDVKTVHTVLAGKQVQLLTGTLRGKERDELAETDPTFARFMPEPKVTPQPGTVYLVCTSAGEVGVDISADHMVCDLSTLDSMAQRFGRVNRRGEGDADIDVVYEADPDPKPSSVTFEAARWATKPILEDLPSIGDRHDASPAALGAKMKTLTETQRNAAFAPKPIILPVTDILFDACALTTVRDKLPGRPPVEPYLHGIADYELPQTHVA